jgi:hypothetical protein
MPEFYESRERFESVCNIASIVIRVIVVVVILVIVNRPCARTGPRRSGPARDYDLPTVH